MIFLGLCLPNTALNFTFRTTMKQDIHISFVPKRLAALTWNKRLLSKQLTKLHEDLNKYGGCKQARGWRWGGRKLYISYVVPSDCSLYHSFLFFVELGKGQLNEVTLSANQSVLASLKNQNVFVESSLKVSL